MRVRSAFGVFVLAWACSSSDGAADGSLDWVCVEDPTWDAVCFCGPRARYYEDKWVETNACPSGLPNARCCLVPEADDCACFAYTCLDSDSPDGASCSCGGHGPQSHPTGHTSCSVGSICCVHPKTGYCACSEQACPSDATPVPSCSVSEAVCPSHSVEVASCDQEPS